MRKGFAAILLLVLCVTAGIAGIRLRFPVKYTEMIVRHAGALEPSLLFAVIKTESGFRPGVRSHRGAAGLMQLTDETAQWMADEMSLPFEPSQVYEPEVNIAIGAYYLNWLAKHYKGDLTLTLCAYNAGMGNVARWLRDERYSGDGVTLHTIPFPETDAYLKKVRFSQKVYEIRLRGYVE